MRCCQDKTITDQRSAAFEKEIPFGILPTESFEWMSDQTWNFLIHNRRKRKSHQPYAGTLRALLLHLQRWDQYFRRLRIHKWWFDWDMNWTRQNPRIAYALWCPCTPGILEDWKMFIYVLSCTSEIFLLSSLILRDSALARRKIKIYDLNMIRGLFHNVCNSTDEFSIRSADLNRVTLKIFVKSWDSVSPWSSFAKKKLKAGQQRALSATFRAIIEVFPDTRPIPSTRRYVRLIHKYLVEIEVPRISGKLNLFIRTCLNAVAH